jgi:hypothetical protein
MNNNEDHLWMNTAEIKEESKILSVLRDKKLSNSKKAQKLGFERTTVRLKEKRTSVWVKGDSLYKSVNSLVTSRLKYPLGFDFYYWGRLARNEYS